MVFGALDAAGDRTAQRHHRWRQFRPYKNHDFIIRLARMAMAAIPTPDFAVP